jgi:hygromycin-B 4-O-kinase
MTTAQVSRMLIDELGYGEVSDVGECGAGAWSTAYRFVTGAEECVVRFGSHEADFRADQAMASYASDVLPIPSVHAVGQLSDSSGLFYCVSAFVSGTPLESCAPESWPAIADSLADALEAMRLVTTPAGTSPADWQEQLLAVEQGALDQRLPDWRAKLDTSKQGSAAYAAGVAALASLDLSYVPLTLSHGDMINRNVHVADDRITGIFDWGCQRWGDHLFELAWFEFWSPWHPNLDLDVLHAALQRRWNQVGYEPRHADIRRIGGLLQIGLDHLAYNAAVQRWDDLDDVVHRMEQLTLI